MIGGLFNANTGWQHAKRYHRGDYELILCTKGPLYLKIENKDFKVQTGEFIIIPPFTTMIGYHPSPNDIEFYWLHFFLPKNTLIISKVPKNITKYIFLPQLATFTNQSQIIILIHQLLALNNQNYDDRLAANHFISIILIELSKNLFKASTKKSEKETKINELKEWIRTNIYQSPTVADMAKYLQINPQYLSRLFKKVVGISPKKYLLKLKLETAQALLIRTNLSVKEVANNSYFTNEKLFLRQFKQSTGLTPSQYRTQFNDIYHNNQTISPILPIPEEITKHLTDIPDPGEAPQKKELRHY
ncbi:helix-turn-helix transcriptional regulator [Limosilactobacillus sp. STM2_1]|uniref:Helix-turn-helix transcriptional regulator n=2 Tax=Limosilactobacillus rudii TaxID=2759755 RepID=A0A7W3YNC3_9LACO|nr:helix-turn-helix transcriptional regulator [Limosilactobacillus rudii]MBB1097998.1 helix-turn-helix transcriptional regulator [Limosilactobacillus rudii]